MIAVAAVLALAWLGVMERDLRLEVRGSGALRSKSDPAAFARAETDLRRANLLNPGTSADVSRALVRQARGHTHQSVALMKDVVRREPENVTAWRVLAVLSPANARRSLAVQHRLDPVNAPRR